MSDHYDIYKYIKAGNSIKAASLKFNRSYNKTREIFISTRNRAEQHGFDYEDLGGLPNRLMSVLLKNGINTRQQIVDKIRTKELHYSSADGLGKKSYDILCDYITDKEDD